MKQIPIGKMKARLLVQQPVVTTNARGGKDTEWTDVFKAWGYLKPTPSVSSGGMKLERGNQPTQTSSHTIGVRYDSRFNINQRVRYGTDYYRINNIIRSENGNRVYLTLVVMWEGNLR